MRRLSRLAPLRRVVLMLAMVTGCAPIRANAADVPALLIFKNDGLDQATVYIYSPSYDFRRVGVVSAGRTETFKVTSEMIRGPVNIVVRLLANAEMPQTGTGTLTPGEAYQVTLPPNQRVLSFLPAR